MQATDALLTDLLQLAANGNREALHRVFAALYPDLRAIARSRLRRHGNEHLDTTSLVHESFLRLVSANGLALADRKHFFTYAAKTMRNIIVEFARDHLAQRRGGGEAASPLDSHVVAAVSSPLPESSVLAVHDALIALEALDPVLAQVVEMRYFAGYSESEIAQLMNSSERTVRRQWHKARAFLIATLRD